MPSPTSIPGPTAADLELALELARDLSTAAFELGQLAGDGPADPVGGLAVGSLAGGVGGAGRAADAGVAMRSWRGPHRLTFELRFATEVEAAAVTRLRLEEEADGWARFWAEATNARRQREHDVAMTAHRQAVAQYETARAVRLAAVAADPAVAAGLPAPEPPVPPPPPEPVAVPTRRSGYQPTVADR